MELQGLPQKDGCSPQKFQKKHPAVSFIIASGLQPNHQMLSRNGGFRTRWFVSAINLFVPKDRTRCRLHASKGSGKPSFVSLVFLANKGKYIYTGSPQLPKSLVAQREHIQRFGDLFPATQLLSLADVTRPFPHRCCYQCSGILFGWCLRPAAAMWCPAESQTLRLTFQLSIF